MFTSPTSATKGSGKEAMMAAHEIEIDLPTKLVLNKDVVLKVKSGTSKLGELRVSKGSIDWVPGNHQTAYRLTWEQLDRLMQEEGRPRKVTR
jgi:hypothetical protein